MLRIVRVLAASLLFAVLGLAGCASKSKYAHIEDDCERAKAYHADMLESVRVYYMLGSTSVAEVAVAERRLKKAREEVVEACGEAPAVGIPDSLLKKSQSASDSGTSM